MDKRREGFEEPHEEVTQKEIEQAEEELEEEDEA